MTEHLILQRTYQFEHNLTDYAPLVPEKELFKAVIMTAIKDLATPDKYYHFFSAIDYFFETDSCFDEDLTVFFEDLDTKDAYKTKMLRGIASDLVNMNSNILKIYPILKKHVDKKR
jgi:hypothetical protein